MARIARPAFLTGSVLLVAGLLWVVTIFRGWSAFWPAVLDKPYTASAVAVLGVVLIRLAQGMGKQPRPAAQAAADPNRALGPGDFADMMPNSSVIGAAPRSEGDEITHPEAPETLEPLPRGAAPEPDEDALGPVAVAMAAFERMQEDSRRIQNQAALRAGFRIAAPGRESRSWIGGAPSMPDHMPWPVLGGAPGVFLAQIDLAELPEQLWGGLGPRSGDLLFFAAADPKQDICVLHLPERGRARRAPTGTPSFYAPKSPEKRLADLIGPQLMQAPRWALDMETTKPVTRMRPGVARTKFCAEGRLDDPALYPFDWPMVFALLDSLGVALRRDLKLWETEAAAQSRDAQAERDARLVTLAKLRLLSKQTEKHAQTAVFDEDEADMLLSSLAELSTAGWNGDTPPQSILSLPLFRSYRNLLETYARHLAAEKPAALPKSLHRSLLPVWQQETELPSLVLGGVEGEDIVLARLYPSAMTGWQGRWTRPLVLTLSHDALEHGDFDEVALRA